MGWFGRSRRSFKVAPGIRVNLGRSGVSDTVGPRGASFNVGGGRGRRRGGGGSPAGPGAGGEAAGCAGLGCAGLLGFVLMAGFCSSPDTRSTYTPPPAASTYPTGSAPSSYQEPAERFYVHGTLNVRSGPGKDSPTVRTLSRGDAVLLGPKDANGWAELRTAGGAREGYVYRASGLVRSSPPSASPPGTASSGTSGGGGRSSAADRGYYLGPRGGCYTYTSSGRKRYVDRSYCD